MLNVIDPGHYIAATKVGGVAMVDVQVQGKLRIQQIDWNFMTLSPVFSIIV